MLNLYTENFLFWPRLKSRIKKLLGRGVRGPEAVFASLVRGLKRLNVEFAVNVAIHRPIDFVCVLSGVGTLRWAIKQKQKGNIKKLVAGPNVAVTPLDAGGILSSPEIDACLVPSDQVRIAYERHNPKLRGKIFVWYAGINGDFWRPLDGQMRKANVLLYCKNGLAELVGQARKLIQTLGFGASEIRYGFYTPEQYRKILSQCSAAVFFSQSESQGIALAEAWAMDVPTLVWNPGRPHRDFPDMTDNPAPYLSPATGKFWRAIGELQALLGQSLNYQPRQWVLEHMTDAVCAQMFLELTRR